MRIWFLLAGTEPDKLKVKFDSFCEKHRTVKKVALWKWKNSYWLCAPEEHKHEILHEFADFRIVEFASAPSPTDIEFVAGDDNALA